MARRTDKEKAIRLRQEGKSYSQIKEKLGISKSTLSGWLSGMPLSKSQINKLQHSDEVIEKIRQTKLKKRTTRLDEVYNNSVRQIGVLSQREFLIAGYFLYWAEGGKTTPYTITLSNTDPNMIRAYMKWLSLLGVPKAKVIIRLHLYSDMNIEDEFEYWHKIARLPMSSFRKPYIKKSRLSDLTYISRGHGTCNVIVQSRDFAELVHQSLKYIRDSY
jgi:transcriptional regulator with XRE-family HTH domain